VSNPLNNQETLQSARPLSLSDRVRSLRLPERKAPPPRLSGWFPWALCLLLGGSTGYLLMAHSPPRPADEEKDLSLKPIGSEAKVIAPGEVVLESKGYIMATHQYKVGPNQVGSKVIELHPDFLEGKRIEKGACLARLDDAEYRAKYEQGSREYDQSVADLEAAKQRLEVLKSSRPEEIAQKEAEWHEAEAVLAESDRDLALKEDLYNKKAAPRADMDEARNKARAQRFRVVSLKKVFELMRLGPRAELRLEGEANVRLAEAKKGRAHFALQEAKWRLDNCKIYAPLSGTILKKNVELYDPLDARAFNLASILCEMADLTDLEVELSIQEREIAKIEPGQPCLVRSETHPDKVFKGVVSRKMPTADRSKGAIPVRVKVLNILRGEEGKYLVPDGGAIVTFLATGKK
jgi:HlyD family secretion protein